MKIKDKLKPFLPIFCVIIEMRSMPRHRVQLMLVMDQVQNKSSELTVFSLLALTKLMTFSLHKCQEAGLVVFHLDFKHIWVVEYSEFQC